MADDWLLGSTRDRYARDRLLTVASALLVETGIDRFAVSEVARRAYCSRATVYRHVGGKAAIIEEVLARSSVRIVEAVAAQVDGLTGRQRAVTALTAALAAARRDRLASQFFASGSSAHFQMLVESQTVAGIAADLIGLKQAPDEYAHLAVRVFLSLLWWPPAEGEQAQLELLCELVTEGSSRVPSTGAHRTD